MSTLQAIKETLEGSSNKSRKQFKVREPLHRRGRTLFVHTYTVVAATTTHVSIKPILAATKGRSAGGNRQPQQQRQTKAGKTRPYFDFTRRLSCAIDGFYS